MYELSDREERWESAATPVEPVRPRMLEGTAAIGMHDVEEEDVAVGGLAGRPGAVDTSMIAAEDFEEADEPDEPTVIEHQIVPEPVAEVVAEETLLTDTPGSGETTEATDARGEKEAPPYEPLTPEHVQAVHRAIKEVVEAQTGEKAFQPPARFRFSTPPVTHEQPILETDMPEDARDLLDQIEVDPNTKLVSYSVRLETTGWGASARARVDFVRREDNPDAERLTEWRLRYSPILDHTEAGTLVHYGCDRSAQGRVRDYADLDRRPRSDNPTRLYAPEADGTQVQRLAAFVRGLMPTEDDLAKE